MCRVDQDVGGTVLKKDLVAIIGSIDDLTKRAEELEERLDKLESPEHRQELEVIKNELSKLKADVEAQLLLLQEELDRIEKSLI
jgi:cob(I)alamin adenosyltransferase